jgi:hypothetical protein
MLSGIGLGSSVSMTRIKIGTTRSMMCPEQTRTNRCYHSKSTFPCKSPASRAVQDFQ